MKFKEYDGSIEALICSKLKEIEEKHNVKVLHAIESGSRAWGFASPDSDYDVRFIYVHTSGYYLGLEPKSDYIDWELNETLDINGWDLSKALQHFHKSNATMFEWANSPVVYYTTSEWKKIKESVQKYFACKSAMYHYYGTANKNYSEFLTEDMVKYKKYFYVLRPILACKWIEKKQCPPPVLFQELVDEVLEENMRKTVEELVEKKRKMIESEKGKCIDKLDSYIADNLLDFKRKVDSMKDDRNTDWNDINRIFRDIVTESECTGARQPFEKYRFSDKNLNERFEFRKIHSDEANQAVTIEQICFPPNEACSEQMMKDRIAAAADLFLVAVDKESGKIAGFLNGLSTDEYSFRDEFFTNAELHNPDGKNIMLLGLDVLPEYRKQGLAKEIMFRYLRRECDRNRRIIVLTCLKSKIEMYEKMGFRNNGIAQSSWGAEQWYEMSYVLNR